MSTGGGGKVKETAAEKAQTEISLKDWQDFQSRWKPAQNKYIARVTQAFEANKATAIGRASGDVDGAFKNVARQGQQSQARRGAGLGSAKSAATANDADIAQAASRGLSSVSADQAAEDVKQGQLQQLTALGRGEKAASTQGFGALAGLSARTAQNDARIAENNATAKGELAGTLIGVASGAYLNRDKAPPSRLPGWGTDSGPYQGGNDW